MTFIVKYTRRSSCYYFVLIFLSFSLLENHMHYRKYCAVYWHLVFLWNMWSRRSWL